MLALSALYEGFAGKLVSLHTAQLPVPKTLATNSRISITSKLIEIKALQVLYSGHLQKTGGRGSYRLVHAAHLAVQKGLAVKSSYSRTYEPISRKFNYSRTYAITPGWGSPSCTSHQPPITSHAPLTPFPASLTQNQGGTGLVIAIPAKRSTGGNAENPHKRRPGTHHQSLATGLP
jgi:hypothetical protein